MSAFDIHYSPDALQDLDNIWDYISIELADVGAASGTVGRILDAVDRLRDFPRVGTMLSSITEIGNSYRFIVVGRYMVFYRVQNLGVYIDRILYGRRDYFRILFGDEREQERRPNQ